jgi:glycerol-3-phosphate acyltransferase PlsY
VLGVWLVCVMLTGYVGLSTMLGALTLPVWYAVMRPESTALVSFGVVMALFVAFTHRSNIQRMWIGSENRARRLWLLRPR